MFIGVMILGTYSITRCQKSLSAELINVLVTVVFEKQSEF